MPSNALKKESSSPISVYGLNYKQTPVGIREKFSISKDEYAPVLKNIVGKQGVDEVVILSTCNRVEFVTACSEKTALDRNALAEAIENISGISSEIFYKEAYLLQGSQAVSHVFKVAAGLDSMILGEPQILGQLKTAFKLAHEEGATSVYLNRLFQRAFGVAKAVRSNTKIAHHAVSVCYAAKELAQQIFGDLREASVLLLGAGDVGGLALQHFKGAGANKLFIANKTLANASQLADRFSAIPLALNQIDQVLSEVDIVIGACTLSREDSQVLNAEDVREASKKRLGQTQFYIDLGVPRNFDSKIAEIADAFLYTIDDLELVVSQNLGKRKLELSRAELIVGEAVKKYEDWLSQRALEPTIRALREKMMDDQKIEVEKTLKRIKRSGFGEQEIRNALEEMSSALIAKTLHQPITHLKQTAESDDNTASLIRDLFLGYGRNRRGN